MTKDEQRARMRIMDRYRDINTSVYTWTRDTEDRYRGLLARVGFDVDKIYWSGFWSQGDGASITGSVHDPERFVWWLSRPDEYPMLKKALAAQHDFSLTVSLSGYRNYVHEMCMTCDVEVSDFGVTLSVRDGECDPLTLACIEVWNNALYDEAEDFRQRARDYLRRWAKKFYAEIEKEYDYLTSDEVVWDMIVANDLLTPDEREDCGLALSP